MSDLPSKLDALGDLLDVEDDTRELDQPIPRRPVGEILRGGREPPNSFAAAESTDVSQPPAEPEPADETPVTTSTPAATATQPRRRAPAPQPATVDRPPPTGRREVCQRTSANLPVVLVERLIGAKQRRWELSQLVASALVNVDLDPVQADDQLDRVWRGTRVQRAYQLPVTEFSRLDQLGEQWRMNRSQVIAVIVPVEMDRLGL